MSETSTRSKPTFGIGRVEDEIPPQDTGRSGGGKGADMRVHDVLEQLVMKDDLHGKWASVVQYATPNGAKRCLDSIEDGSRVIPDGDFDFEVRRVTDEETGKRVSQLWARFNPDGAGIPVQTVDADDADTDGDEG